MLQNHPIPTFLVEERIICNNKSPKNQPKESTTQLVEELHAFILYKSPMRYYNICTEAKKKLIVLKKERALHVAMHIPPAATAPGFCIYGPSRVKRDVLAN